MEYVKLFVHAMWRSMQKNDRKFEIRKIIVFDESDPDEMFHEYVREEDFACVRFVPPGYKIEIRYTLNGRKYRIVLRGHQRVQIPVRKQFRSERTANVISSMLMTKVSHADEVSGSGSGIGHDVTDRLSKYLGPNVDFHGTPVHVHDIVPFDDHEYDAERFSALRVHLCDGRYVDFDYEKNERIVL
jgi:hypothetical protein